MWPAGVLLPSGGSIPFSVLFWFVYFYLFSVHVQCTYESQRTTCESWSSPSTTRVLEIKLRSSGLAIGSINPLVSHLPSPLSGPGKGWCYHRRLCCHHCQCFWDRIPWSSGWIQTHYVVEGDLWLLILLPLPPRYWDNKHGPLSLAWPQHLEML